MRDIKFLIFFLPAIFLGNYGQAQKKFEPVLGEHSVQVQRDVMITASDGVKLATDIYRPSKDGVLVDSLYPVVLQRTPYGKSSERFTKTAYHLASKGYVVALQDLRGRYNSEGEFTKYNPLEASDGATTVEYLAGLPYGDGRVGMFGTSYGAHTQADASKLDPKGLSAMIVNMGGMTNAWDHAVRQGGAFELGRELTWAFRQIPAEIKDTVVQLHFQKETINDWYEAWPFRKGLNPLSVAPNFENYILEEARHADYDDYWKETGINWQEYFEQTADVPMVHIGGWYDIFLRGTIENYTSLKGLQSSPKWMIIGPWTHSGNSRTYAGDVDFGKDAAIPGFETVYQGLWFDWILKNKKSPDLKTSPIQLFLMGNGDGSKNKDGRLNHGGYWLNLEEWPPINSTSTSFYFHESGALKIEKPEEPDSKTTFTYDPSHPVPTLGGNVSARVKDGAFNQRERPDFIGSQAPYLPLKSRSDIVVFRRNP